MKDVTETATKAVTILSEGKELSISSLERSLNKIRDLTHKVMREDLHYGTVPGVDKKFLFKPGAEILAMTFRLIPRYNIQKTDHGNGHWTYEITCDLHYQGNGAFMGQGVGVGSTLEKKYRYRNEVVHDTGVEIPSAWWSAGRDKSKLPKIVKNNGGTLKSDAVVAKEKLELTFAKVDGKWHVVYMKKIENKDIADTYNTVLKMAKKRALVDAIITALGVSDIYTQDPDTPEVGIDEDTIIEKAKEENSASSKPARKASTKSNQKPGGVQKKAAGSPRRPTGRKR